jgi:hypothetical protein
MYRQQLVGTLIPDLIVDGSLIVDTKTVNFVHRLLTWPKCSDTSPKLCSSLRESWCPG